MENKSASNEAHILNHNDITKKNIPPIIKSNIQGEDFYSLNRSKSSFYGKQAEPVNMGIDYASRPEFISFTANVMSPNILRSSAKSNKNLLVIHDGIGTDLFWRAENEGMSYSSDYKMHRIGTCHIWNRNYPEISYTDPLFLGAIEDTICDYRYGAIVVSLMSDCSVSTEKNNEALNKIISTVRKYNSDSAMYFLVLDGMEGKTGDAEKLMDTYNGVFLNYTGKSSSDFIDDFSGILDKQQLSDTPCSCCAPDEMVTLREAQGWVNYGFRDAGRRSDRPRLLLIGDSISHGYEPYVCSLLPNMTVDFLQTSYCMGDIALIRQINRVMSQYRYDIIHIAIGLHYSGIDEDAYSTAWASLLNHIKHLQPTVKIVAALATTCTKPNELLINIDSNIPKTNAVLKSVCSGFGIKANDLYSICIDKQLPKIDTLHFAQKGYEVLAQAVADAVSRELT